MGHRAAVRTRGVEHEFEDDRPVVSASPVGIGGSFSTTLRKPDSNWALFNVGASVDFGQGMTPGSRISGFLMGTATAGKDDGEAFAVTLGVRVPL